MKTLNPNNRNPKNGVTHDAILSLILEEEARGQTDVLVGVGNHTVAFLEAGTWNIILRYYDTWLACLYPDDMVKLWTGGYDTESTRVRLDWVLQPLGFRMVKRNKVWKVYSIATGSYRDFFEGMEVTKGAF